MKFQFPKKIHEEKAKDFIEEFDRFSSPINGDDGLRRYLKTISYEDWLLRLQDAIDIANTPPDRVPSFTYFYVSEEDGRIIGIINIRMVLNSFLLREAGHIGYSIRPSERGKGYGKAMLRDALQFCRKCGMESFLLVCSKDNPASAGIIQSCGGILENEIYSEHTGEIMQRYWIGKPQQS